MRPASTHKNHSDKESARFYAHAMKYTFNGACFFASPFTLFALLSGLTAPLLLGIGVLFSLPALLSLVGFRRAHWLSLWIAGASLAAFFLIFFVPVWVAAARAQTPSDHLRVGEAFAQRGQLFGNDSKAFEHYLTAANGGDAEAQNRVGEAYLFRHYGVQRDLEQARRWLSAAASSGNVRASKMLKNVDTVP